MLHQAVLAEILEQRVVSSRGRSTPRGVKRKMSNYPLRRPTAPSIRRPGQTPEVHVLK